MVVDSLSKLSLGSLCHMDEKKQGLVKDIYLLVNVGVHLLDSEDGYMIIQ